MYLVDPAIGVLIIAGTATLGSCCSSTEAQRPTEKRAQHRLWGPFRWGGPLDWGRANYPRTP